jgi:hypothetical protein
LNLKKKKDLFQIEYIDDVSFKLEAQSKQVQALIPLQKRINKIYKEYLKIVDEELFNYLIEIEIDATIFLL